MPPELEALRHKELEPEADAEQRLPRPHERNECVSHPSSPELGDGVPEGTHAGENDSVGLFDGRRLRCDLSSRSGALAAKLHAVQVAHSIVYDRDVRVVTHHRRVVSTGRQSIPRSRRKLFTAAKDVSLTRSNLPRWRWAVLIVGSTPSSRPGLRQKL